MRPCNRYILIKPIEEEEEDNSVVLVPDDYKAKTNPYTLAEVLDWAEDVNLHVYERMRIVVNTSMVEEIKIGKEKYFLVLENYVLGISD